MFKFFSSNKQQSLKESNKTQSVKDFEYLNSDDIYFDSACQTLRSQPVIDAMNGYYHNFNACGGRVKYEWGLKVDDKVEETRQKLLQLTGKSSKDYAVVFTLNTTYGINLILQQLKADEFENIVTSDIEHNSVFLPTISWSKRHGKIRKVFSREENGSLSFEKNSLKNSVIILNTVSNIDGRKLLNVEDIVREAHGGNGVVLLDAAQHFSHHSFNLKNVDFDALFGSGHKMYGPSIGFIIAKKAFLQRLDPFLIGGGTVTDVQKDHYNLVGAEEIHARFELGLQDWAGIIGLGKAIGWVKDYRPGNMPLGDYEKNLSKVLFEGLKMISDVSIFNQEHSSTISFYSDKIDAHRLAIYLGQQKIMCRSGYFCCHYYLKNLKKLPPLLRVSLGAYNTEEQVKYFLETLKKILCSV